jgi:hypothetical protein
MLQPLTEASASTAAMTKQHDCMAANILPASEQSQRRARAKVAATGMHVQLYTFSGQQMQQS